MSADDLDADSVTNTRTPEADLALIRSMMHAGRQRMGVDGRHLVLWGAVLMLAFIAQYLSIIGILPPTILGVWVPAYAFGFTVSHFIDKKTPRMPAENNIALKVYATAWNATGISILVYFFLSLLADNFDHKIITVLTTTCIGSSFYVNSVITGLNKLKFVAAGWWCMTAFFALVGDFGPQTLLILSAASFFLLLVPGYLLQRMLSSEA